MLKKRIRPLFRRSKNTDNFDKLKGIDPQKFLGEKDYGLFLGLGLMSNDLGDLIHLQALHAGTDRVSGNFISAEIGRKTGRNIYITRLALSHLYNILEFFDKRSADIQKDDLLNKIIENHLSENERSFWNFIIKLSRSHKKFGEKDLSIAGINPKFLEVIKLSEIARNDITFHYHGAAKHLKNGFRYAFKDEVRPNTKFAFVTEIEDVAEDRRYYIDISLQKFLEKEADLSKDLQNTEPIMIEFIAAFNKVVYKILREFHKNLGFVELG